MNSQQFNEYYAGLDPTTKKEQNKKIISESKNPLYKIKNNIIIKPKTLYMVVDIDNDEKDIKAFETEELAVDYCLDEY